MGAYLKPFFSLLHEAIEAPERHRQKAELERKTQLYIQCIREGRDPYSEPGLVNPPKKGL
jgi:hypothetical protein